MCEPSECPECDWFKHRANSCGCDITHACDWRYFYNAFDHRVDEDTRLVLLYLHAPGEAFRHSVLFAKAFRRVRERRGIPTFCHAVDWGEDAALFIAMHDVPLYNLYCKMHWCDAADPRKEIDAYNASEPKTAPEKRECCKQKHSKNDVLCKCE